MGLSDAHRAIIDELAGDVFSRKGAESFHLADTAAHAKTKAAPEMNAVTRIDVSSEERARMAAAVNEGLEVIFANYDVRGIANAREIYTAINQ